MCTVFYMLYKSFVLNKTHLVQFCCLKQNVLNISVQIPIPIQHCNLHHYCSHYRYYEDNTVGIICVYLNLGRRLIYHI